jgi:hypothetical protein
VLNPILVFRQLKVSETFIKEKGGKTVATALYNQSLPCASTSTLQSEAEVQWPLTSCQRQKRHSSYIRLIIKISKKSSINEGGNENKAKALQFLKSAKKYYKY